MKAIEALVSDCEQEWNTWKKYGDAAHLDNAHAYVLQLEGKKQLTTELAIKVDYLVREIKGVYRSVHMPSTYETRERLGLRGLI